MHAACQLIWGCFLLVLRRAVGGLLKMRCVVFINKDGQADLENLMLCANGDLRVVRGNSVECTNRDWCVVLRKRVA